jgi:hypothetical protein
MSLSQINDPDKFERAFSGASVHDMFNYMSLAVFFPIELATGFLAKTTGLMVKNASPESGEAWQVSNINPVRNRQKDFDSNFSKCVPDCNRVLSNDTLSHLLIELLVVTVK